MLEVKSFPIQINTSNQVKLEEFKRYLGPNIVIQREDMKEPDADCITIVRYKASQFHNVLIDDTSLEIEGEDVGVNVKWLLQTLHQHIGKKAKFVSLLGIRKLDDFVYIFKGEVEGTIVLPRGKAYGFLHFFQPDGTNKTLAEELPDQFNARYYAVRNFLNNVVFLKSEPLLEWTGVFQNQ